MLIRVQNRTSEISFTYFPILFESCGYHSSSHARFPIAFGMIDIAFTFTGLSAAYELTKQGHSVTVFERDTQPGGLAIGYQEKGWNWSLEKHYHHWFTNDVFVLGLTKEIGYEVIIKRPKNISLR